MKKIIKGAIAIFFIVFFSVGTVVFSCYLLIEKDAIVAVYRAYKRLDN